MKKVITLSIVLGMIVFGAGIASAATLSITANVATSLTLDLSPTSLTFNDTQPGLASTPQTLTATTTGTGNYQLTLLCSNFTKTGDTQGPAVLQFKESSSGTYKSATAVAQNMLAANGTAVATPGDSKTFDMRINFPLSATNGAYGATVTITAAPM